MPLVFSCSSPVATTSRAALPSLKFSVRRRPCSPFSLKPPARRTEKRSRVLFAFAGKAEKGGDGHDSDDARSKKPDANEGEDEDEDEDAPPSLPTGAWRNFRASLVASAAAAAGEKPGVSGDVWSARMTPENVHLFQEQDRELAR